MKVNYLYDILHQVWDECKRNNDLFGESDISFAYQSKQSKANAKLPLALIKATA